MSSREKQRKERKTAVEENGRKVKKKKRKNSKPEKYYKDGRIVYKEDRLITSRCNVSSESFTFHLLLDLRFSSFALFHPLLSGESIYIFFPRRCLSGKRKSSFFNQVHLTNFLIEFLGEQEKEEEKSEEKNVRYHARIYSEIRRSLVLIYSMSTNRKHNRFVTRHWIYLQQR